VTAPPRAGLPGRTLIESPWANNDYLASVTLAGLFPDGVLPLSRAEAMRVPAVARSRHLLAPTIARLPLRVYRADALVEPQPLWPSRTDGALPPFHRMVWTVDDVLFGGWSLWRCDRGDDGYPLRTWRVPIDEWSFDPDSGEVVDADGHPFDEQSVILIPGPHEGVLTFGRDAIRDASALQRAARRAGENPVPTTELHQTNDAPMDETDIEKLVGMWVRARQNPAGTVSYTPESIELRTHGQPSEALLIDGRNAAAVDIARTVGLPAAMIDATGIAASLTYETQAGRNAEFLDYGLAAYMSAISARLSMDDVVPRGQRTAFDAEELLGVMPGTTGAVTDD
jgi:hypothetical protein